jgi:hypothetical protein
MIEYKRINNLLEHYKSLAFGVNTKHRLPQEEVLAIEKYIETQVVPIMWNKSTYGIGQNESLMAVAGPLKANLNLINTLKKKIHEDISNPLQED